MPTLETRIETYLEMADKLEYAKKEIERLKNKYEKSGQECNSGHKNILPVSLWDCPMCTDEKRKEIERVIDINKARKALTKAQGKKIGQLLKEKEWLITQLLTVPTVRKENITQDTVAKWIQKGLQQALKEEHDVSN